MNGRDRLIELLLEIYKDNKLPLVFYFTEEEAEFVADKLLKAGVIVPPVRIGDTVWALQSRNGCLYPKKGIVYDMFFNSDMVLVIAVKHIARGEFGKTVFLTREEAEQALKEREKE